MVIIVENSRYFSFRCSLTTLKSYTLGRHGKFIYPVKYCRQSFAKLAKSTNDDEKEKDHQPFLDYLGFQHPYYSTFFVYDLSYDFWPIESFYSRLKDAGVSEKEMEW